MAYESQKPTIDVASDRKQCVFWMKNNRIRNIFILLICYFSVLIFANSIANIILSQVTILCDVAYEPLDKAITNFHFGTGVASLVLALIILFALILAEWKYNMSNAISVFILLIVLPVKIAWLVFNVFILFSANNECITQKLISFYASSIWIMTFIDFVATMYYILIRYMISLDINTR